MTITTTATAVFRFDNTDARDLEGLSMRWKAAEVPQPKLVKRNHALADVLKRNLLRYF